MSDKDQAAAAEGAAPKKSKKLLMIIVIAAVVLAGGGAGAFFMLKGSSAAAAPKKGTVVIAADPVTINLADGHYLKLGFSLQETTDAGAVEVNPSEALNLAIDEYTGRKVAELATDQGRETIKVELLKKIVKSYTEDGKQMVMDVYFTQFVTQ